MVDFNKYSHCRYQCTMVKEIRSVRSNKKYSIEETYACQTFEECIEWFRKWDQNIEDRVWSTRYLDHPADKYYNLVRDFTYISIFGWFYIFSIFRLEPIFILSSKEVAGNNGSCNYS